ncbi:phenylacetate-CoA ligase [Halospina denitrificans]|uniref:Phenylacetate-CoA ligase n=1 Tax=Halospina denitrificans TaxID=332522 RepID=A0A4V3EQ11_9GAMM|nr:phenylacetate--CoA ligase family protein [Halospina denitrificans]TDT39478.1 phenylacetate-CoA ligase [Halospina denitrificans]
MLESLSKHFFYPLWELKDRSIRLAELKRLEAQQWQSAEIVAEDQWARLSELLRHAQTNSPWYRKLFREQCVDVETIRTPGDFQSLPVTTKKDIRNNTDAFIADGFRKEDCVRAKTGGSTGVSLDLYFDKACQERRNAAQFLVDRWAGWDLGVKKAAVWGNPPVAKTPKQKIRQVLLDRTVYLDTMDLSPDSMAEFVALWRQEKPKVIFGHAHSIFQFARYVLDSSITDLRPKGIVATSMMLLEPERQVIEQAFGCSVTNRYGCEEVGLIACECESHNGLHLNMPHVYVEFLDAHDQPVSPGQPGKIVVTDLNNYAMPLIRYRVEDVGVPSERSCSCGRSWPLMERLEGRVADFLKTPDGSQVAGISLVERTLTKVPGLEQMQLVQEDLHFIRINRVKARDYTPDTDDQLINEMRGVFPETVRLQIETVPSIPQEPSGKFRFSICKV